LEGICSENGNIFDNGMSSKNILLSYCQLSQRRKTAYLMGKNTIFLVLREMAALLEKEDI